MMEAPHMVHTRWPRKRLFDVGVMFGRGMTSEEIAKDPEVRSRPDVVRRYIKNMGHSFQDVPRGNLVLDLPPKAIRALEAEASKRKRTVEALLARALSILADEPHLLSNVLDDEI